MTLFNTNVFKSFPFLKVETYGTQIDKDLFFVTGDCFSPTTILDMHTWDSAMNLADIS